MALPLESPSRVWRRIEEGIARGMEMPSLPSIPGFDDSAVEDDSDSFNASLSLAASRKSTPKQNVPSAASDRLTLSQRLKRPSSGGGRTQSVAIADPTLSPELSSISVPDEEGNRAQSDPLEQEIEEAYSNLNIHESLVEQSQHNEDLLSMDVPESVSRTSSSSPSSVPRKSSGNNDAASAILNYSDITVPDHLHVNTRRHAQISRPPALSHSVSSLSSSSSSSSRTSRTSSGELNINTTDYSVTRRHSPSNETLREGQAPNQSQNTILQQPSAILSAEQSVTERPSPDASREPTFSSSSEDSNHSLPNIGPMRLPNALSSPAVSLMTPTPAIYPNRLFSNRTDTRLTETPRAGHDLDEEQDVVTPMPRRDFYLSIINSTARPHMAQLTPHPRGMERPGRVADAGFTPGATLPGGTKAPTKRRVSFTMPLNALTPRVSHAHDDASPAGVNSSFVSTASSHDLTIGVRANASFDPIMGLQEMDRFNLKKLNQYLWSLNNHLKEENSQLNDRVVVLEDELAGVNDRPGRDLSEVAEDERAEELLEAKDMLEKELDDVKSQLQILQKENQVLHADLEEERKARARDNDRWRDRITQAGKDAEAVLEEQEDALAKEKARAEGLEKRFKALETDLSRVRADASSYKDRAEQAERLIKNDEDSSHELNRLLKEKAHLNRELQEISTRFRQSEHENATLRSQVDDAAKRSASLEKDAFTLRTDIRIMEDRAEAAESRVAELEKRHSLVSGELETSKERHLKLAQENRSLSVKLKESDQLLSANLERTSLLEDEIVRLKSQETLVSADMEATQAQVQHLKLALEESDRKMSDDQRELLDLRAKLHEYERGERRSMLVSSVGLKSVAENADVESLERELDEANKEIGRLNTLLNQSPARKALEKAKEMKIQMLEKENEELLQRLRGLRDAPPMTMTPKRGANMSGISPLHRQLLNMTLKTPRTPGEPLNEMSLLFNLTDDADASQLMVEIHKLQKRLDLANESIDDKLDKLEEAGLGVVGLTRTLEEARARINALEDEIEVLRSSEDKMRKSVHFIPCSKCKEGNKNSLANLQKRLESVTAELDHLKKRREEESAASSEEKAALKDAARRLNAEVQSTKEELKRTADKGRETERSKSGLQGELTKAQQSIAVLEQSLAIERDRLRQVSEDQKKAGGEREDILSKLQVTELEMERTRRLLMELKEENAELRSTVQERNSDKLEERLESNQRTIDRLRQERSDLANDQQALQRKLATTSREVDELTSKHSRLQTSYDGRRRQVDHQAEEIERLRTAVAANSDRAKVAEAEKQMIKSNQEDLKSVISSLEADFRQVQQEAQEIGADLMELKAEKLRNEIFYKEEQAKNERVCKQYRSEIKALKEHLHKHSAKLRTKLDATDALDHLKVRHRSEVKGLYSHIQFLHAQYVRENAFRMVLGQQKVYLLQFMGRYERSEKRILAVLAQISGKHPQERRKPNKLKVAALLVIFIRRTSRDSQEWRRQLAIRDSVKNALEDVRRRRALKAGE